MDLLKLLLPLFVSLLSGGLSGAVVSTRYNKKARQRTLRIAFYRKLNDMYSIYVVRFAETPEGRGRYLNRIVGQEPTGSDKDFIKHRADFIQDLVDFNELEEATKVGQAVSDNELREKGTPPGLIARLDLKPELRALDACMKTLRDTLALDNRRQRRLRWLFGSANGLQRLTKR